jgi:hypothetical protein
MPPNVARVKWSLQVCRLECLACRTSGGMLIPLMWGIVVRFAEDASPLPKMSLKGGKSPATTPTQSKASAQSASQRTPSLNTPTTPVSTQPTSASKQKSQKSHVLDEPSPAKTPKSAPKSEAQSLGPESKGDIKQNQKSKVKLEANAASVDATNLLPSLKGNSCMYKHFARFLRTLSLGSIQTSEILFCVCFHSGWNGRYIDSNIWQN